MPEGPKLLESVPVERIFLWLGNPRHNSVEAEAAAIARLCDKELVYPLARDIAKIGLNPLERFALVPIGKARIGGATTNYTTAEGNRRICALKLLNDPELAPANLRKSFEKLAEKSNVPSMVSAAVFPDFESFRMWLDRIHNGLQGGIGRKDWNAEQKQRFDGGSKNKVAQALLDYAETEKFLTAEERAGKLTTVQRFVGNSVFREVIGIDQENPDSLGRTRPKKEFDVLVKRFIRDLVEGEDVNSRMNRKEIIDYARPLNTLPGVSSSRVETEILLESDSDKPKKFRLKKPKTPEKATRVRYEETIYRALKSLGNEKLLSLYHSICAIELDLHTPIVAIGTWSFFETLTACAGRNDDTSIDGYFSKNKLASYGITGDTLSLRSALVRVREYGNTTKHHRIAALFNGDQLNNDIVSLKPVILKCIEEAAAKSP
ncbi:hypothetical protein FHS83_003505 [Rhizomicrobium palustre]|uniref:Uncharacterized protein n=1 Tax=Rhizomicrobium palustre TaxID=189966 RepID=A0A846N555_9PROT|nr:hypothetical protein [Rhizomicrobium palustre]NIK90187.1 hypothetical protein [Rhizomicrobium palustre]